MSASMDHIHNGMITADQSDDTVKEFIELCRGVAGTLNRGNVLQELSIARVGFDVMSVIMNEQSGGCKFMFEYMPTCTHYIVPCSLKKSDGTFLSKDEAVSQLMTRIKAYITNIRKNQ